MKNGRFAVVSPLSLWEAYGQRTMFMLGLLESAILPISVN